MPRIEPKSIGGSPPGIDCETFETDFESHSKNSLKSIPIKRRGGFSGVKRAEIAHAALPGQKLQGKVEWVGREVDAHSRTVPVRIAVSNEGGRLKPGMFATAWISTGGAQGEETEKVVAVPAAALQRVDDRWIVFLPRGEGRFEVRPVERGRDLGDEVAILSGLKPGERVVVEGAFVLRAEAEKGEGGGEHHH